MIENLLIVFKQVLAQLIPDYPAWIEDEIVANVNRVKQVEGEIADKTII